MLCGDSESWEGLRNSRECEARRFVLTQGPGELWWALQ